jgi:hypothetical protein
VTFGDAADPLVEEIPDVVVLLGPGLKPAAATACGLDPAAGRDGSVTSM